MFLTFFVKHYIVAFVQHKGDDEKSPILDSSLYPHVSLTLGYDPDHPRDEDSYYDSDMYSFDSSDEDDSDEDDSDEDEEETAEGEEEGDKEEEVSCCFMLLICHIAFL